MANKLSRRRLCPVKTSGAVTPTASLNTQLKSFWKMGEATGAVRADSIGVNNLTNVNNATQVVGVVGNATGFAAASLQYLQIADASMNPALHIANQSATWSFWVKFASLPTAGNAMNIWTKKNGPAPGTSYEWSLDLLNTAGVYTFRAVTYDVTAAAYIVSQTTVAAVINTWYFVAATWDSVALKIGVSFNNGAFTTATSTSQPPSGTQPMNFGVDYNNGSPVQYLDGAIDAAGRWNRILTAGELTQLYNAGAGIEPPF